MIGKKLRPSKQAQRQLQISAGAIASTFQMQTCKETTLTQPEATNTQGLSQRKAQRGPILKPALTRP